MTILASKKQWASVGRNLISRPKGIAVCVYSNARLTLDYLFDISQTVGREIHPTNWRLSMRCKRRWGSACRRMGFRRSHSPISCMPWRESVAENYNQHYLQGLRQETKNHLFEIPAGGFEAQYIQLLTDSVSYFIGKNATCQMMRSARAMEWRRSIISTRFRWLPIWAWRSPPFQKRCPSGDGAQHQDHQSGKEGAI